MLIMKNSLKSLLNTVNIFLKKEYKSRTRLIMVKSPRNTVIVSIKHIHILLTPKLIKRCSSTYYTYVIHVKIKQFH